MAESYTVQAILTVKDNMSAAFRNAAGASTSLGGTMRGLISTGAALQVGMSAVSKGFQVMSSHIGSAVSRYDQLNNFPRVMSNLGIASKDANAALKTLDKGITGLPTTLDAATQGVTRFVSKNNDIKKSTEYFLAMNNAVLAGGASMESQGYAVEQLSQAYSKGKMDMEEWRSIQTAMPAQLNQVAKAMGMTADQLGEGLRNGTISMDEFMDTMVKLNKEGIDGFASFEKQALTATGGIRTAFTNMGTAITRGLANSIGAIDKMLERNDLPTIAEMINKVGDSITKAFKKAESAIKKINLRGIINGLTPAFEALKLAATTAGKAIGKLAGFMNKHAEGIASLIPVILLGAAAFKGYKKISGLISPLNGVTDAFKKTDKAVGKTGMTMSKFRKSIAGTAKMAGFALIIASLALLAKAMGDIGKLGPSAIAPMMTFGVVVGGLAAVFGTFGKALQTSMGGIIAFSAGVTAMALAMAPVASTGLEGAVAMGAFGIVIAGLVVTFATFGTALTAAIPAMISFGATIVMIGAGMKLAAPFVTALTGLIKQLGATFSVVGDTVARVAKVMSKGFQMVADGIATIIDAVSGGFVAILDAIAGVIESIGTSAQRAGRGFKSVAEGITLISGLSLWDIGKSLGAVALGLGEISTSGRNLPAVASAIQGLVLAITMGAAGLTIFNAAMANMSTVVTNTATGMQNLKAALAGFTLPAPNAGPMLAAFASIITAARQLVPALISAGTSAGAGLASGLSAGAARARSVVSAMAASIVAALSALPARFGQVAQQAATQFATALKSGLNKAENHAKTAVKNINSAFKSASSGAYSAGRNIGQGLANGMRSMLGTVRRVAAQLAAAAEAAIRAKAKIHSPSRVTEKLGEYWDLGFINAIKSGIPTVRKWAERLVHIPTIKQPDFAMSYGGYSGGMSDSYSYGGGGYYVIEVPVNIDGKEVSRVTAPYMEEELNRRQTRESRKRGKR